jgi:NAD(P)-dependent dehydrogenase (short-subunit alcohol dehydrogenase family)
VQFPRKEICAAAIEEDNMNPETINFDHQVVVVTGAGGGLGRRYALEFARRGACVVVNDLGTSSDGQGKSASMADSVVAEIVAAGGRAVASYDSVSTRSGGVAIVQTALDHYGRLDAVVNNAGALRNAPVEEISDSILDTMIDVHLKAAFYVTQPALKAMRANRFGRIVFVASAAGVFGSATQAAYGAAKAGQIGLMNALALETAGENIHSNVLLPTATTRMAEGMKPEQIAALQGIFGPVADKIGSAADGSFVAPLVVYLASNACNMSRGIFSAAFGRYARAQILRNRCEGPTAA